MEELLAYNIQEWREKSDSELFRIRTILDDAVTRYKLIPELQREILVDISAINYILLSRLEKRYHTLLFFISIPSF